MERNGNVSVVEVLGEMRWWKKSILEKFFVNVYVNEMLTGSSDEKKTVGQRLTVHWTQDAEDSFKELGAAHANLKSAIANILVLIQRLADQGRLRSPDKFNNEGNGFFAIKNHNGIRAYGWYEGKDFVLSHFIYKNQNKLSDRDKERMNRNRNKYQHTGQQDNE